MATQHSLPYYAPADTLPAPLPTVAEIRASEEYLSSGGQTPVVRIGEHFAVKYGGGTELQEAENMLFVRESTSIAVPTVYAAFHDEETKTNYIVQEFIPGRTLGSAWGELTAADKQTIASQLRRDMDELRSIPSQGYYGGIWRQPTRDFLFANQPGGLQYGPHTDSTISGPQETEEQWTEAMLRYLDTRLVPSRRDDLPLRRRWYHAVLRGHEPVFTHSDLCMGNIMLREDKTAVIIDWECSGWYPSYWEYCRAVFSLRFEIDWYVLGTLTPTWSPTRQALDLEGKVADIVEQVALSP
jgi:aminoglycoside phosphotransferase